MPNITYKSCYYLFFYYPQTLCNFHVQVLQIKLKYHCSKLIKLQKFLMQQYKDQNLLDQRACKSPHRVSPFSRGLIFTRALVSLALRPSTLSIVLRVTLGQRGLNSSLFERRTGRREIQNGVELSLLLCGKQLDFTDNWRVIFAFVLFIFWFRSSNKIFFASLFTFSPTCGNTKGFGEYYIPVRRFLNFRQPEVVPLLFIVK